jgi:hypothetical protein
MRTVAIATCPSELHDLLELLRGARARLGDATLAAPALRVPFEFVDSEHTRFGRNLSTFPTGSVPVMQAYLIIGSVTSHEADVSAEAGVDALVVDYDESAKLWTLRVSPQAVIRVSVGALDVSVLVSDQEIGEQSLTMCT